MRSRLLVFILVLLSLFLAGTCAAQDAERILSYRSDITVHQDASMTVTETIKVMATGDRVKHGIYRDFPTTYVNPRGERVVVRFDVESATRDGSPEPYTVEGFSNGERVKIGSADTTIEPGEHTYTITYITDRQLGFFADYDELYWNVTGNGWVFPIDKVIAVVTLPKQLPPSELKLKAYTGRQGSKAQDYDAYVDSAGHATFVTNRPLGSYEGLTIAVGWPKGIVTPPSQSQQTAWFLRDNLPAIFGLLGLILVTWYYIYAWNKVGRDPRKGTIIPLYEPPDGMSPAALRYICRMGYDNKALAAALIDMGVKRYAKITEEKGVYTVSRYKGDVSTLSPDEQALADKLLGKDGSIDLKDKNYATVQRGINAMKESLDKGYGEGYFSRNGLYTIPGILLSILALIAGLLTLPDGIAGNTIGATVWIGVWTAGCIMLVKAVLDAWRKLDGSGKSCMGAGCLTLFALPFLGGELVGIFYFGKEASPVLMASAFLFSGVNYLFAVLLRAPSKKGRALLDKIEGFQLYMSVAEKEEMDLMNPPEKTPDIFEKYLPYALALDVEHRWAEKFAAVLAAAIEAGSYDPDWYTGHVFAHGFTTDSMNSFASSIGNSLSGAISSSSTAPGSTSGSGGGGSSGGGGGGGGGGGW